MPNRVFAVLIAFLLFWSGLSASDGVRVAAQASPLQTCTEAQADYAKTGNDGSLVRHLPDNMPTQAQFDLPGETLSLLPAPLNAPGTSPGAARPHAWVNTAQRSPDLAGPLRPPCGVALAA